MLLAINAKAYYNTATFGSPTWVALDIISNAKLGINWAKAGIPTRASKVNKSGKTLADVPFTFSVKQDLTDTAFLAIWAALISNTAVMDLLILNASNATNGARGVRGEFNIMSKDDDQSLTAALSYDIVADPADTANAFSTAVVTAGSPVFTTF